MADDGYREYVLAELRAAHTRARLYVNEIETIGVALRGGFVTTDIAVQMLWEANTLDFLLPCPPTAAEETPTSDSL